MEISYMKLNTLLGLSDVGKRVRVYNGNKWIVMYITERMRDHYMGEFILTKKQGGIIHKKKVKKKNKTKRK
jgi:ribosomal protein S19